MSDSWLLFCFIIVCIVSGAISAEVGRYCALNFLQKSRCENCPHKTKMYDGGTVELPQTH